MLKSPKYSLCYVLICVHYITVFKIINLQFIKLQYVYIQINVTQITCVVFPLISVLLLLYSRCDSLLCSEFCPFHMQKKYQEPSNEHFKRHRGGMMEMIYKSITISDANEYVETLIRLRKT
jgi:hypothetical protein